MTIHFPDPGFFDQENIVDGVMSNFSVSTGLASACLRDPDFLGGDSETVLVWISEGEKFDRLQDIAIPSFAKEAN